MVVAEFAGPYLKHNSALSQIVPTRWVRSLEKEYSGVKTIWSLIATNGR